MSKDWLDNTELYETKYVQIQDGTNEIKLSSDGEEVKTNFNTIAVEFRTDDDKVFQTRSKAILNTIARARGQHGTVVNRKLVFTKKGEGRDTKYTNVRVE